MKHESYDVAFRRKIYCSVAELQNDVDQWLQQYNHFSARLGKYCYGKTPMQTFLDSKHIAIEKSNHSMYHQSSTSDSSHFSDNFCA